MRSYIIPLIVSFAALASCSRQAPEPKYDINCPVRSVMVHASKGELDHVLHFDMKGNMVLKECFNEDGSFRFREEYEYDTEGRVLGMLEINAEGQTEARYEYEYDGEFVSHCTIFGMNSEKAHEWVHSNDGEHIVRTVYSSEDIPFYLIEKRYEGDVCIETTKDYGTGELLGSSESLMLPDGRSCYVKSETMNLSIEYDAQSLPVKAFNTSLDSECGILWERALADNPERRFEYEFDRRGNWIQRKEYSHPDSVEVAVIKRKIRY